MSTTETTLKETRQEIFREAMVEILIHEGGYSNYPDDAGGETFAGISRAFNPAWKGWEIIDKAKEKFSPENAKFNAEIFNAGIYFLVDDFYQEKYWKVLNLDQINYKKIVFKIFDMAVHLGIPRVSGIVQNCLNVMNFDMGYELTVDNIIGNITIALINTVCKRDEGDLLLKLLMIQQGYIYMKLIQNNPSKKKDLKGWINRIGISVK